MSDFVGGAVTGAPAVVEDGDFEQLQTHAMRRYRAGAYADAEALFRRALAACPADDPQLAVVYNNLAATLEKRDMPREAEELYVRGLAICEQRMPADHPRLKHIRAKLEQLREKLFSFPGLEARRQQQQMAGPLPEDFVSE